MVEIKRGEGPGTWRPFMGTRVVVTCPECSVAYQLDHEVKPDGTISPSLDCPTPTCTWHVHARLLGWDGRHVVPDA